MISTPRVSPYPQRSAWYQFQLALLSDPAPVPVLLPVNWSRNRGDNVEATVSVDPQPALAAATVNHHPFEQSSKSLVGTPFTRHATQASPAEDGSQINLRKVFWDVKILHRLRIFDLDVCDKQITNGRLANVGMARTLPHFCFNPELCLALP
ncbi:hypothetical protein S40293_07633 [Stachybotrys chartarum IBT 40293]|nr:hypothetical protein S40293_07633 [Stachybotrys chartarum IBT 40293]